MGYFTFSNSFYWGFFVSAWTQAVKQIACFTSDFKIKFPQPHTHLINSKLPIKFGF